MEKFNHSYFSGNSNELNLQSAIYISHQVVNLNQSLWNLIYFPLSFKRIFQSFLYFTNTTFISYTVDFSGQRVFFYPLLLDFDLYYTYSHKDCQFTKWKISIYPLKRGRQSINGNSQTTGQVTSGIWVFVGPRSFQSLRLIKEMQRNNTGGLTVI